MRRDRPQTSPNVVERWPGSEMPVTRRPDFFIVGAPKSGTTAMYEYLRAHPQLFLPELKELRYFGSDLQIRHRPTRTLDDYLAFFSGAGPAQRIGTAYVWYLFSTTAADEIHEFNPDARIVVMLRNPVDMVWALHSEHLYNGNEDIADFTAALDAEPDRRAGRRIPADAHLPQGLVYSEVPRYTEQLRRYVDRFGRDRVSVTIFDDFVADPAAAYGAILRFLDVDASYRPPAFDVINANRRIRSQSLRRFLASPPDLPRRVIKRLVPGPLRRGLYERAKRINVADAQRAPMPDATRERLRSLFAGEVEELSAYLGRDLSAWDRRARQGAATPDPRAPARTP